MIRLHVNIDHVATLRNQRDTSYPSVTHAAELCLEAGAVGITVHLREDRRHIRDADVVALRARLQPHGAPFHPQKIAGTLNLEMAPSEEMARLMTEIGPDVVSLVPERREERTTEGGLDCRLAARAIERVQVAAVSRGVKLSLFIEAEREQVRLARELGAEQVEFHTGHYAESDESARPRLLAGFREAAIYARELGLEVAMGHGLTTKNVGPICAIPHVVELNIGHAIVCDALFLGLSGAVRAMREAIAGIPSKND